MVSGQLQLRGAEPFSLASPTTISGTNDGGALTGIAFQTPVVETVRDVPKYGATAFIDAAFSLVQPGVGQLNEDGSMSVQLRVAVDLHIVVDILPGSSDCRAAPVNLTLTSTAPYDPETGRVTLRAPNFSVPAVVGTPACNGLLVDPVNEALAGAGHSLSMIMQGSITPPPAGEPTATALAVAPAGSSDLGEEVALTATVTQNPAVLDAPAISGVVEFKSDGASLGTAEVQPDGTATLTTADIPAGPRQLTAAYGGAPPDWDPSTSAAVAHSVIAPPFVTTDLAGEIRVGGDPRDFGVTVHNTGFGEDLEDARVEVTIVRTSGGSPIGPDGPTPRVILSRVVNNVATPIPLTGLPFPPTLSGEVADSSTWEVPVGEDHTESLRLQVNDNTVVGPLAITFNLVRGTGPGKETLATTTGSIAMVTAARLPSTIASGVEGFPPFIPHGVPVTPRVRQGNVAELENLRISSEVDGMAATGTWSVFIDGVPAQVQHADLAQAGAFQWLNSVPLSSNWRRVLVEVSRNVPAGEHQVTVRYAGNAFYAPAQQSWPITVEEAIGAVYECVASSVAPVRFTANVEVEASLPSVWAVGQELPVDRVQVRMRLSRTAAQEYVLANFDEEGQDRRIEMLPDGTLTPDSVTSTDSAAYPSEDPFFPVPQNTDHLISLNDGSGTVRVDPVPGTVDTYTLGTVNITATPSGFSTGFICEPGEGEVHTFGDVTSAGTTLTVDRSGPVGAGTPVTLTASALPAAPGAVEFRDGTTTIGVVPVDANGTARMTTANLPAGTRNLTARFLGGLVATSPSPAVELKVVDECLPLDEGSGAIVRLTYMELLGRCPDPAGYAFWVGRLDGGMTSEAFARSIARTPEAVGRVVDDAYRTMLGRSSDSAGRVFWTGRLLGHGRYDQLLADLGASPEFWSLAGSTNTGFVTRVYGRLLDRSPEQSGLDYWVGRLDDGMSRRVLILTLANLDEPLGVIVGHSYGEILDRAPDATERAAGIAHLRSTGDRSGLYAQLIGTGEFATRAGTFPTSTP